MMDIIIGLVACVCIITCTAGILYKTFRSEDTITSDELVKQVEYIEQLARSFITLADGFEDYDGSDKMEFVVDKIYDIITTNNIIPKIDKMTIQAIAQREFNNTEVVEIDTTYE